MPLPFLIVGAGITALYGAKKGYDAYDDNSTASNWNEKAKRIYDESTEELTESKESANNKLEKLGKLKMSIYEDSLGDFVEVFSQIKNIDFEDNIDIGMNVNIDYSSMLKIKDSVVEMKEILGGGLAALGGGAAAGFGAFGGVGMLATASTGTAIGGLSGVAATNATLAWLGGGSLATGGMGMAGGMAVLGGVVAGPVLAIGGAIMAAKAEKAKHNAYANFDKAKAAAEQMEIARVVLEGITHRVEEFNIVLESINEIFEEHIEKMEDIVDTSNDYSTYAIKDKEIVMMTASIAQTIKNICDAPIIDEDGKITKKSKRVLKKANKFLTKLEEV